MILMHDDKADRTTDGEGLIREKTYDEVKKLNAGTETQPLAVPTLREFLEYCAGIPGLLLNLEIKVYLEAEGPERVAYTVNETVKMCEELGLEKQIMFNCFDAYVLEYIYNLRKEISSSRILSVFYYEKCKARSGTVSRLCLLLGRRRKCEKALQ